jgi:hypothetical protein
LSNNNPEPFKLSPEERKRLMTNLFGIQVQFERLVQYKMDAQILRNTEISPNLKETYEKWVNLLNSVVDAEIEVTLKTALSSIKPTIAKQMNTFGDYMKLSQNTNEFTAICSNHNLLLRSQTETEQIPLENGEIIFHKVPIFQPISIFKIDTYGSDYDFRIYSPNMEALITFGTYSDIRSQIRTWSIHCRKCGLTTNPVSNYYGQWNKQFEKAFPIRCYNCKRYLLVEANPKIRQPQSHMIPPTISSFFNGLVI